MEGSITPYRRIIFEERKKAVKPDILKIQEAQENKSFMRVRTLDEANLLIPFLKVEANELHSILNVNHSELTDMEELKKNVLFLREVAKKNLRRDIYEYGEGKARKMLSRAFQEAAMMGMWGEVRKEDRIEIPEEAQKIIEGNLFRAIQYLRWQVLAYVPELAGKQNPWTPLMNIVNMGGVNIRLTGNTLRTDLPLLLDGQERVLGCWSEGQEAISRAHPWTAQCSQTDFARTI